MITIRQIERLWTAKSYDRLFRDLLANRPEARFAPQLRLSQPFATAALALIRLYELNQDHTPLYSTLLRYLLAHQQSDGGWADPMTTSICLRALLLGHSSGDAISRALTYLANLQKSDGIWPNIPIRRLPADPFASAFILYQLADSPEFRCTVRLLDALHWFEFNDSTLDPDTRALWQRAGSRYRTGAHSLPSLPKIAQNRTPSHISPQAYSPG